MGRDYVEMVQRQEKMGQKDQKTEKGTQIGSLLSWHAKLWGIGIISRWIIPIHFASRKLLNLYLSSIFLAGEKYNNTIFTGQQ